MPPPAVPAKRRAPTPGDADDPLFGGSSLTETPPQKTPAKRRKAKALVPTPTHRSQ